ncbi:MAG: Flp family type IVb pilin [Proteobacteria bacterium]|nr:Flp family type IVb pilin [Pseudomonadota bacterium]MBW3618391.1 Flp family type IVb pilin [Pseudomonadota bacterium]
MSDFCRRFLRDQSGATAIEYALIAGLISMVIITAAVAIGGGVQRNLENVETAVQN